MRIVFVAPPPIAGVWCSKTWFLINQHKSIMPKVEQCHDNTFRTSKKIFRFQKKKSKNQMTTVIRINCVTLSKTDSCV